VGQPVGRVLSCFPAGGRPLHHKHVHLQPIFDWRKEPAPQNRSAVVDPRLVPCQLAPPPLPCCCCCCCCCCWPGCCS
jgi:hypothetical protein